jgi:hypothetical protein
MSQYFMVLKFLLVLIVVEKFEWNINTLYLSNDTEEFGI